MRIHNFKKYFAAALMSALVALANAPAALHQAGGGNSALDSLLPSPPGWKLSEGVQRYKPETLFEYIDGAAEAYLSYDFKELVVGQYRGPDGKASLTAEIYDLGQGKNAFGIYSAERFPESHFIPVGVQGYLEEGSLNFLAGPYYVKLVCYEGGPNTEEVLMLSAADIVKKIKDPGAFPVLLEAFPREGLIANSEKFLLRNFMGFKFLQNGFTASYKDDGQEFDCFLIDGKSSAIAEAMLKQYLDNFGRSGQPVEKKAYGVRFKNHYLLNVFVAGTGNYICGVTKIKDGKETMGEKYLQALTKNLQGKSK
jgi:hypothetical protein